MRELLYLPIIHSESDLGSLGSAIDRRSAFLYGEKWWAEHKKVVARFWKNAADYLLSLDATNLKIYQDGLAADGELGRRIVEEAAKRGSVNHQILLKLMNKGAVVRKTEDPSLLIEEWKLARESATGDISGHQEGSAQPRSTEKRDRFIAEAIDQTLREGETAIILVGAYHNVGLYLPQDITIAYLKDRDKVRAYFREFVSGSRTERFSQLANYVASPISVAPLNRSHNTEGS